MALLVGIPDELYWELTEEEVVAVLKLEAQRQRAANLRAGLVAATICNNNPYRKKGARRMKATDFIRGPKRHMSVEEARKFMAGWAGDINKQVAKAKGKPTL